MIHLVLIVLVIVFWLNYRKMNVYLSRKLKEYRQKRTEKMFRQLCRKYNYPEEKWQEVMKEVEEFKESLKDYK